MLSQLQTAFEHLEQKKNILFQDLEKLENEQLGFHLVADSWSVLQVVEHIFLVEKSTVHTISKNPIERKMQKNLRELIGSAIGWLVFRFGLKVKTPSKDFEPQGNIPLSDLQQQWEETRTTLTGILETITEEKRDFTIFRHPISGPLDASETLLLLTQHYDHHLRQIKRIRQSEKFS